MNALPVGQGDILEVELSPPYSGLMGAYQLKVEKVDLILPKKYKPGDFIDRIVNYPYEILCVECSDVGRSHGRSWYYLLPQPKGDWLSDAMDQHCPGYSWAFHRMHIVKRAEKKREKKFAQGELFA